MTPTPRTPGVEGETRTLAFRLPRLDIETLTVKTHEIHIVGPKPDTVSTDPEAGTKSEGRSEPDLSQAIKERDEAVRHLRAMSHVCPKHGEVEAALAFLTTMEKRCG